MPFKLKLKKSRHYSVVSKSLFVLAVELLDGTGIECTLSAESTGQECLDVVCQKLGMNQPTFFGLQYVSRNSNRESSSGGCWLELDRPIKRQLDKHARGLCVFVRVMYYVKSGVRLLNDEVTRNHYFLQLKMDVIDGRISCTPQQAIELASYCMQAEFGNFDVERHTAHYLKDFQLFPKNFTNPHFLETLTEAASSQHASLHNTPQGIAEEQYICACQKLNGYGQEKYSVRDKAGDDVCIKVSVTGITVSYTSKEDKVYQWSDISNVINHKRDFTVESVVSGDRSDSFQFPDAESAKDAWRFCILQHMFYRQFESVNQTTTTTNPRLKQTTTTQSPSHPTSTATKLRPIDSYEDISHHHHYTTQQSHPPQPHSSNPHLLQPLSSTQRAQSTSCLDLQHPASNSNAATATTGEHHLDTLRSLLPSYRPAPDYETAMQQQQKYRHSAATLVGEGERVGGGGGGRGSVELAQHRYLYSSQPEIHQVQQLACYQPDVTHNNIEQQKALLASLYGGAATAGYAQSQILHPADNQHKMVDLVENVHLLHLTKPPPPYPSNRISSNSTPDLAGASLHHHQLAHHHPLAKHYSHHYPPPQATVPAMIVSGSSPDLVSAAAAAGVHHHFSPYLYQQQWGGQQQGGGPPPGVRSQSYLPQVNGTYENLATILNGGGNGASGGSTNGGGTTQRAPQAVIVENPNITKHIKKVYDEHGNIIYCMPANMKQILEDNQLSGSSSGFVVTRNVQNVVDLKGTAGVKSGSQEPIYENIPFAPWQDDNEKMRARTQSIQSAPEISQVLNNTNSTNLHTSTSYKTSRENLYANVNNNLEQTTTHNSTYTEPNPTAIPSITIHSSTSNSNLTTLNDSPAQSQSQSTTNLNNNNTKVQMMAPPLRTSSPKPTVVALNNTTVSEGDNMSRTNTFIVNNSHRGGATAGNNSTYIMTDESGSNMGDLSGMTTGNSSMITSDDVTSGVSSSGSGASASGKKKKRWGILMGRSKSSEKVKSATLGREKEKAKEKDKGVVNTRYRWSTGLSKLHPLPPSISKETMCQLLENKLSDSQLFFEFDKIPKKKPNSDYTTALLPENAAFNRHSEYVPYEDNRLRLAPTKDNKSGYINASRITATVGSKQRFYIAAQGPSRLTLPHFWQCVWDSEVYMIVQLTDVTEDSNYLPDATERCINVGQDYQVCWEFSQLTGHCHTSKVRLLHVTSRRYRTLWHLHYTDWGETPDSTNTTSPPDKGQLQYSDCPQSVAHCLGFLEELRSVQRHSMSEIPPNHNKNPPVLVHCGTAVGRTGLIILGDLLLYTVDHNQEVDIPTVVGLLRHQRAFMVQTIAQYRFVYCLLIHYLKQTRLI